MHKYIRLTESVSDQTCSIEIILDNFHFISLITIELYAVQLTIT